MTTLSMIVKKKERSLYFLKKSDKCIGGYQSHGASSRGDAQAKFRGKYSQDEERANNIYSASDGQMWREVKSLSSMKLNIELSWQVIQSGNSPNSLSDNLVY